MSDLIAFTFEAKEVRTIDRDGQVWFVAKDVCKCLGLTDTSKSLERLRDNEKGTKSFRTLGGNQKMLVVNEPGLYRLIFTSNKAEAEAFQDWVYHEVLPQIRKHGVYADTERKLTQLSLEQIHANLFALATEMRRKYPHLNISDENVLLEKQGDASDMRYWGDMEKMGLPIIRILDAKPVSKIQIEFSFYGWKRFGPTKKAVVFEKMRNVCNGLSSYNATRQYAFHDLNIQDTEFVLGFSNIAHAKRVARSMQDEIVNILV